MLNHKFVKLQEYIYEYDGIDVNNDKYILV